MVSTNQEALLVCKKKTLVGLPPWYPLPLLPTSPLTCSHLIDCILIAGFTKTSVWVYQRCCSFWCCMCCISRSILCGCRWTEGDRFHRFRVGTKLTKRWLYPQILLCIPVSHVFLASFECFILFSQLLSLPLDLTRLYCYMLHS